MPMTLRANDLRYKVSEWCKRNTGVSFDVPFLAKELGMNPDSRADCAKVYSVIKYWRDKGIETFKHWVAIGIIPPGETRYIRWDVFLLNYNRNDAYIFLYDYDNEYYIQPGFDELERMDKKRLQHQWNGILTIIDEMQVYDTRLLIDGTQKPVTELLKAGKNVDMLLGKNKEELEK
jgi:hypothetical protein